MRKWALSLSLLAACTTSVRPIAAGTAPPPSAHEGQVAAPPGPAPAVPGTTFTFGGVEVFGSRKVAKDALLEVIGLPPAGTRFDSTTGDFGRLLIESKKRLTAKWPFALCRYSVVGYPGEVTRVTVNLVDEGDAWRMPFLPAPRGEVEDPDGLTAAWADYLAALSELRSRGAMPEWGEGSCRGIVCYGGFGHPELGPREQRFIEGVPRNVDALVRLLREDRDENRRMSAAMLLSYAGSRERIIEAIVPSVRDGSQGVRNEALRLLGAAQKDQARVLVPLEPVLEALWFPSSTDRNKAGWALVRIVETEGAARRKQILATAGEVLVQMAGMQQPIEQEPARKVLTVLAGRDLGADEAAWRRWLAGE